MHVCRECCVCHVQVMDDEAAAIFCQLPAMDNGEFGCDPGTYGRVLLSLERVAKELGESGHQEAAASVLDISETVELLAKEHLMSSDMRAQVCAFPCSVCMYVDVCMCRAYTL